MPDDCLKLSVIAIICITTGTGDLTIVPQGPKYLQRYTTASQNLFEDEYLDIWAIRRIPIPIRIYLVAQRQLPKSQHWAEESRCGAYPTDESRQDPSYVR